MNPELIKALNRTFLLMRDDIGEAASDEELLAGLMGAEVVLIADTPNIENHPAECAFITAALLMMRSAHTMYIVAPDVLLRGLQLPLTGERLVSSLVEFDTQVLPGRRLIAGAPDHDVDLCVRFGDSRGSVRARRTLWANASAWAAFMDADSHAARRWEEKRWPAGALALGALIAGEAMKCSMRRLRAFARGTGFFDLLFAANDRIRFELAPRDTPQAAELGRFDIVSGGAITHALLYSLARFPGVHGNGRVIEADRVDLSNANRYQLMSLAQVGERKIDGLLAHDWQGLVLGGIPLRYEEATALGIGELAPRVLVGVDHIPSRWLVQEAKPAWLGIGATTHWSAMASAHEGRLPCARCLHPRDDVGDAPIPTAAFVSFWAGLLLSVRLLRHVAGEAVAAQRQQFYLTAVRPEIGWQSPVDYSPGCPSCASSQLPEQPKAAPVCFPEVRLA